MQGRVSVIMPTYQQAALVGRAVASVFYQRGIADTPIELIVVDDGSTDDTEKIIAAATTPAPHTLTYLRISHTGRPGLVRNEGLRRATGEYIGYCDADDLWLPHHLATCLSQFRVYPGLAMVETWWSFQAIRPVDGRIEIDYAARPTDGFKTTTNSRLHTRLALETAGTFSDREWREGDELWARIAQAGPVRRLKIPTTVHSYTRLGHNISYRHVPGLAWEFRARFRWLVCAVDGYRCFKRRLKANQSSPLPCTRGRGVGGEGERLLSGDAPPHPRSLSPEYRGEGSSETTIKGGAA